MLFRSTVPQRGEKRAVLAHAETNAREALERKLAETTAQAKLLEGVAQLFALPAPPERIEVYDNSHIMGTHQYGVMIVAGAEGFRKAAYRKFAIRGPITPGDDFAMMRETLERRFSRGIREGQEGGEDWPDIVLIDGGKGQVEIARQVLAELGLDIGLIVGVAKGEGRKVGLETLIFADGRLPLELGKESAALMLIAQIREDRKSTRLNSSH